MLVAGPNLALQRVADLDHLRPGEVLRFTHSEVSAGGKGVNVFRAALRLGVPARLVTFAPGVTGAATVQLAAREGIDVVPVASGGEVRVATIVREADGRVTVLNEPGPSITAAEWAAFVAEVERRLEPRSVLVCTGTLPPGGPATGYAELVELARDRGCRALVDAGGALLEEALRARPDVVKPNLVEAELTLRLGPGEPAGHGQPVRHDQDARERALRAARCLVAEGAGAAMVTAGEQGAALACAGGGDRLEERWLPAPAVTPVNPIGAGDCFAAVVAAGLEGGRPLSDVFEQAVGVAAASVEQPVPGDFDPRRAEELM